MRSVTSAGGSPPAQPPNHAAEFQAERNLATLGQPRDGAIPTSEEGKIASYPLFDWLRFTLASAVALGHEGIVTWGPASALAVQVFFALSGWLIGGILLRTGSDGLSRFFYNRGTRIWIPYFLAVAAIYLFGIARDSTNDLTFEFLFYDLTFTHNYFIPKTPEVIQRMPLEGTGSHFWSIAVEEQFYLMAPLVIVLFPWGRRLGIWLVIAAAMYAFQSWYGAISLGVLAAVAQRRFGDWHATPAPRAAILAGALVLLAGLAIAPDRFFLLAPPFAVFVVLLAAVPGLRKPVGEFLGGMSYPFYLNHWTGMFAANFLAHRLQVLPSGLIPWTAYGFSILVGAAAYLAVDRTIQRNRSQLFTPRRGWLFAAMAYSLMTIGLIGGLLLGMPDRLPAGS